MLCNMSGIFRDSFQNVLELLDDLFQRAAAADEPPERNFIRCAHDSCLSNLTMTPLQNGAVHNMIVATLNTSAQIDGCLCGILKCNQCYVLTLALPIFGTGTFACNGCLHFFSLFKLISRHITLPIFKSAGMLSHIHEGHDFHLVHRRKHAVEMKESGLTNPAARLFSNPAGDYGSMVNERVGAGNWDSGNELGDTWASRNAFSYGRCAPARSAEKKQIL